METAEKKIAQLESEVKVLKNEVQAVLLDLREKMLDKENPFNAAEVSATTSQQIIIDRQSPYPQPPASRPPEKHAKDPETEPVRTAVKYEKDPEPEPELTAARNEPEIPPEEPRRDKDTKTRVYAERDTSRNLSRVTNRDWRMNLVTIAGLARWADESAKSLGRVKTETILDISEMMGLLPPDLKMILVKLLSAEANGDKDASPTRDFLDSLINITTLLGKNNDTEKALLSIMPVEADRG